MSNSNSDNSLVGDFDCFVAPFSRQTLKLHWQGVGTKIVRYAVLFIGGYFLLMRFWDLIALLGYMPDVFETAEIDRIVGQERRYNVIIFNLLLFGIYFGALSVLKWRIRSFDADADRVGADALVAFNGRYPAISEREEIYWLLRKRTDGRGIPLELVGIFDRLYEEFSGK